jgi:toxin-antitoxin system PIN domain toxin
MTDLLDVNVWLALADANHSQHEAATHYWQHKSSGRIAFCRITMLGFLRLSTHPKVLSRPLSTEEAWTSYRAYRKQPGITFIEDSVSLDHAFETFSQTEDWAHHLWTDAYLAALAHAKACRLVSFDRDFYHFKKIEFLQLVAD